ncbi:MAG: hypothetical protein AOA65_0330 [Candidatus Bathyarchaeota archaeon BA1]|nr:MAG: hypothetical protein AOA65_0330 [Candidatus Bathyarchaeota archaeon BA1]
MAENVRLSAVRKIMIEFADRTGLPSDKKPRRYLWTDAFAVCNFLELHRQTGEGRFKELAVHLVDQVHHVLGRHREDDLRKGWISGLDEQEGEKHPTIGGLRIGKELYERGPDEPFDEFLEWERDGQYYHYLTKWMHALNQVHRATGDPTYNRWAIELAKTAHAAFTYVSPLSGQKRMYWKMSIDLSRPLVPSMGQLDPIDGLITYYELRSAAPDRPAWPDLRSEIADITEICKGKEWITDDPLGIGDLLCNAYKVVQLVARSKYELTDLLPLLLGNSCGGLEAYLKDDPLELPADCRLAFRELGLSLGLHAVKRLWRLIAERSDLFTKRSLLHPIESLLQYAALSEEIEKFWLKRSNRKTDSWKEHRNINMVMLATSLVPDGYLEL